MRSPYWFVSVLSVALFLGLSVQSHNGNALATFCLGLFALVTFGMLAFMAIKGKGS